MSPLEYKTARQDGVLITESEANGVYIHLTTSLAQITLQSFENCSVLGALYTVCNVKVSSVICPCWEQPS